MAVDDSLQRDQCARCRLLLASLLGVFSLTRVGINVAMITMPNPSQGKGVFYSDLPMSAQLADCLIRAAAGVLGLVPFFFRFSLKSSLHVSALGGCLCPVLFWSYLELLALTSNSKRVLQLYDFGGVMMFFCWMIRVGQAGVACTKLALLGWRKTHQACMFGWMVCMGLYGIKGVLISGFNVSLHPAVVGFPWFCMGLVIAVIASILLYEANEKQRMLSRQLNDHNLVRLASRSLCFLRLGACLILLDAIYLPLVEAFGDEIGLSPAIFMTCDTILVMSACLILGGIIGPLYEQEEVLQELAHMARTFGKRIAFPGRVNPDSRHCIVSFPGKYAEEWDAAVRMVEVRSGACSLACVFLTDQESGLGAHVENPEQPGHCWCKALYGKVPAAAYVSIVENPGACTEEELRFKKNDAEAMGQIFLQRREGESQEEWQKEMRDAETLAKQKCDEADAVAPWGCQWFHDWKKNVDDAVACGQTLHVFYFETRVGCGKLPWLELSNEISVRKARENGGLGASQTAEVAYLERCGYQFEEHDVAEFYGFMETSRASSFT